MDYYQSMACWELGYASGEQVCKAYFACVGEQDCRRETIPSSPLFLVCGVRKIGDCWSSSTVTCFWATRLLRLSQTWTPMALYLHLYSHHTDAPWLQKKLRPSMTQKLIWGARSRKGFEGIGNSTKITRGTEMLIRPNMSAVSKGDHKNIFCFLFLW